MTLVELMVVLGIGSLVALVLGALMLYSSRSFESMANYTDLNQKSRLALDQMSKEIRQSRRLISRSATSLEFQLDGTNVLRYTWNQASNLLTQTKNGGSIDLLNNCVFWTNSIFQRNLISNSLAMNEAKTIGEAKLVQLQWICAHKRANATNSESIQSMKIVIRKRKN